jgi:hypothetical protein
MYRNRKMSDDEGDWQLVRKGRPEKKHERREEERSRSPEPKRKPMRDMFPVEEMRDFIGEWLTESSRDLQHCINIHDLQNNFGNYIVFWLQNRFQKASYLFFEWERETYTKKPTTSFGNYHRLQRWRLETEQHDPYFKSSAVNTLLKIITFEKCLYTLSRQSTKFETTVLKINGYFSQPESTIFWNQDISRQNNFTLYKRPFLHF